MNTINFMIILCYAYIAAMGHFSCQRPTFGRLAHTSNTFMMIAMS